jgi:hypothetical protein
VLSYASGAPAAAAQSFTLGLTVLGNRAVSLELHAYAADGSAPLLLLAASLPAWAALDPHGAYVAARMNVTLPPL